MPAFILPYGKKTINFSLDDGQIDLILPADTPGASDPQMKVRAALAHPLGEVDYAGWKGAKSVVISINDKTRPVPLDDLIPPLLAHLDKFGIQRSAVTFLIATGTHLPLTKEEMDRLVPVEIRAGCQMVSHDCDDRANLTYIGETSRRTPVWIYNIFMSADVRIVIGDIEPHHFMGFSGGAKGASIGLTGRETINANHAMLVDPNADIGIYLENPMRQDVEEIGDLLNIDLVVNAVLNHHKEIVEVFAGRPREVMLAGIPVSLQVCTTRISSLYDIVIASAGGHPKDINLYQSQKAISHAAQFTQKGGTIIVAAECIEGSGSPGFENFIAGLRSFSEVEEKFKSTGFQVGPHKAFQLARQAANYSIHIYSSIPKEKIRGFLLNPVEDIRETVALRLKQAPQNPRIAVLPYATTTLPRLGSHPA